MVVYGTSHVLPFVLTISSQFERPSAQKAKQTKNLFFKFYLTQFFEHYLLIGYLSYFILILIY